MTHPTILSINGVPIHVRHLQHGDIAVWHPINGAVREVVESICRGRGRWDGVYKNWLVFRRFADDVLDELRRRGDRHE